ncbi:unnamed protein product [Absidia cylindrospora]
MSPPLQPTPRRIFRQRQPIQLHPFTEDLKKYHSLIGRKDRFSASTRLTLQDSSDYYPPDTGLILSDEEDYEYANSDGFVVDSDVDDPDNMNQTLSVMDTQMSDNNSSNSFDAANNYDDDDDAFNKVEIRKRRRAVIMESSDDDLEGSNNDLGDITTTSPTSSTQIYDLFTLPLDEELDRQTYHISKSTAASNRIMQGQPNLDNDSTYLDNSPTTTRKSSTQINDIFAYPLEEELERQNDHNGKSAAKTLITYGRSKKARMQKRYHNPSNRQKSNNNTGGVSDSLTEPSRKDYPIFDPESLDDEHVKHLDTTLDDADDGTTDTSGPLDIYDEFDADETNQASNSRLPTTPRPSSTTSIRQTKHGSVRNTAYDDDDGFIVEDDDYGSGKRRRNTTLREIRKNKRHLKGILPHSFTTTYEKQLEEEENDKHRRSFTIPTKRVLGQDLDDGFTASTTTTPTETEYSEIEAATLHDDHNDSDGNTSMDSRRYHEQQRSQFIENVHVDCGVHTLRTDATSVDKLTYLDDEHYSLFRLQQQHSSLPTTILDQPFTDTDYYVNSPTITYLFDLAYQSFYGMWINLKNNSIDGIDENATLELQETNMSRLLGFMRFISMCLSRGYNNNNNSDGEGCAHGGDDDTTVYEMQQFLIGEMDMFMDHVLKLVNWQDDTEMAYLEDGMTNQGSTSPLLVVLVYFVEWSYQIHKTLVMNPMNVSHTLNSPHWTLEISLRRLLWYLLSLGPSSVSVVPVTSLLFRVTEPRVMEAWVVALQLIKSENMNDSTLWPSFQYFLNSMEKKQTSPETVWDGVELTWKWVLTVALLQRIKKTGTGYGKVMATELYYDGGRWSAVYQLFQSIIRDQKETLENLSMTDKMQLEQFRLLTLLRLTFYRCHLLLTNYNWMWNALTLQYLYDLVRVPSMIVFTGDPIKPQQLYQQQDKVTAAKYFPPFLTTYDGTIPDDEIYPTDTCGVIFLKIISYGSRKFVDLVLKSSSSSSSSGGSRNGSGDDIDTGASKNERLTYLEGCLTRVTPSYLVVRGVSFNGGDGTSSSILLRNLISNPASILHQSEKSSPFVLFAFDYSVCMCILHATSRLGKKNNIALKILNCQFEFSAKSETENAFADEISLIATRTIDNIKEKWDLV